MREIKASAVKRICKCKDAQIGFSSYEGRKVIFCPKKPGKCPDQLTIDDKLISDAFVASENVQNHEYEFHPLCGRIKGNYKITYGSGGSQ